MIYLGCLPILLIILIVVVISIVRGAINTAFNVVYGLYLTIVDALCRPFRPTPVESEIDDMNYYAETSAKEKIYTQEDGEYVSFKKIKNKRQ